MSRYQGQGTERFVRPFDYGEKMSMYSQAMAQQVPQSRVATVAEPTAVNLQADYAPQVWINHDKSHWQNSFNSESYGGWWAGWWPRGTYANQIRLEPGAWPPIPGQARVYDNANQGCSPERPCPYGGPDNKGVMTMQNGKPTRMGMCYRGKCSCPLGTYGPFCEGPPLRSFTGDLVWPNQELTAPTTDPYGYGYNNGDYN